MKKRKKKWFYNGAKEKKMKVDKTLKEVEETLAFFYSNEEFGYINEERKVEIKLLEDKNRHIILGK
jgi:hypothetical protein